MFRGFRLAFALAVVATASAGQAHAQYYGGYGGYGWGGWGGETPQGSIARGLGYYNVGAGIYNQDTAIANSINADTIMRWNQYIWLGQQEANKREYLRRARREQRDSSTGAAIYKRLLESPSATDVSNGDALNVILEQITDPRIHSSALRLATQPLESAVINDIPFQNASEGITLSLNQLTAQEGWPLALQGDAFAEERAAYQQAIADALKEDEEGDISPATLANVRAAASRIRVKFDANRPKDPKTLVEGENYVKALSGMARMLENPQIDKVMAELKKYPKTTLGNLLAFMHTYNLRFGPAKTPAQRAVYQALYPLMAGQRDTLLKDAKLDQGELASAKNRPTDFFSGMHLDYLDPKAKQGEPK
ncbi:hypothetical protein [Singulisphaera acidiphila]|uniref:Uncharacterized protein n=1 Tax=Singulisphaera acidiphila (strain ATCC BAA-1392 / DSM 18658 / VKM B-2454 / MOB10) TaxID=886293 RepID=L0DE13_SINAD|nr:hypothetical protein [Singulisphaera acidiphila]AGA27487.1 hypothetical protein Sinac_3214 [Singulisphaera acidiphila DSM 18658]